MENYRELLLMIDTVSKEYGLSTQEIISFVSDGIKTALKKNFPEGAILHIDIDDQTGHIHAWRLYKLVDSIVDVETEMLFSEVENEPVVDGFAWESFDFQLNRQQYNITKQVTLQKIKQRAKEQQFENLMQKNINLHLGNVKIVKKDHVIVDMNGLDVVIERSNLLPKDYVKVNDKLYFTIEKNKHYYGTRTSNQYLVEVLKKEIVQIEDGEVEIVSCVRNPGFRSKVIVQSQLNKYDAVKTCLGFRGAHLKNFQIYLPGESIDFINYNESPAELVIKAISPVSVHKILIDEDTHTIDLAIEKEQIAQAIGKGGKNIEMISSLLNWKINIFSLEEWKHQEDSEQKGNILYFMYSLDCDEELAIYLTESGYSDIEEIAYLPLQDLELDELDEETIEALRVNAKESLADSEKMKTAYAFKTLNHLGFEQDEIQTLIENKVVSVEDIADLSTYDLQDILPNIDIEKSKDIIMKARKSLEELHVD